MAELCGRGRLASSSQLEAERQLQKTEAAEVIAGAIGRMAFSLRSDRKRLQGQRDPPMIEADYTTCPQSRCWLLSL